MKKVYYIGWQKNKNDIFHVQYDTPILTHGKAKKLLHSIESLDKSKHWFIYWEFVK